MGNHLLWQKPVMAIYHKLRRLLPWSPVNSLSRLYASCRISDTSLRATYYAYLLSKYCYYNALPTLFTLPIPSGHNPRLQPQLRQALIDDAFHGQNAAEIPIDLIVCQSWNIFKTNDFACYRNIAWQGSDKKLRIKSIAIFNYPSQMNELSSACTTSQISSHVQFFFVYAYMLEIPEFAIWMLDYMSKNPGCLLGIYFTDSHHQSRIAISLSIIADFVLTSHPDRYQLMSNYNPFVYIDKIYLNQWSPDVALSRVSQSEFIKRDRSIYGLHNLHPQFPLRNNFLSSIPYPYSATLRLNSKTQAESWHNLNSVQALDIWSNYSISCIVPTRYDLTTRVLDALSVGHSVLVPKGCTWLDHWISYADQQDLGVYRYNDYCWSSLYSNYQRILAREYHSDSQARAVSRSKYIMENFSQRQLAKIAVECFQIISS